MKNKKILIICPSMWPNMSMWGETQRMYYLANHLGAHGWHVLVISPSYDTHRRDLDDKEQKYTNIYLGKISQKSRDIGAEGKRRSFGMQQKVKNQVSYIINQCGEWIYGEPDIAEIYRKSSWVRQYGNEICKIIQEEAIKNVIISVPSFTFMKLGKLIKRKCVGAVIIYDYRDPWYLWRRKKNPAYFREKYYLQFANCIVGFSERFRNDMIKEMGIVPRKINTVYNGYFEKGWKKLQESKDLSKITGITKSVNKMIITYTGYMSLNNKKDNYRNPANLISAVKNIPDVELYLVGISGTEERVEDNVHYIGEVTQQKSFAYMKQSDVLVSIHDTSDNSGEYLISGKFYDYMRSGKVILHIGKENGLMPEFIKKFKLGVVCQNKVGELQQKILLLRNLWKEGKLTREEDDMEHIIRFERGFQNSIYEQIIDKILV